MLDEHSVPCQCRDHEPSTLDRPALFLPLILIMFASFAFLFALADLPYGVQIGSLVPYTALVVLGTFSAQRGQQPYLPRKCGIATFTSDLLESVAARRPQSRCFAVPVNDIEGCYRYPEVVRSEEHTSE